MSLLWELSAIREYANYIVVHFNKAAFELDALALAVDIILQGTNGNAGDECCVIVEYTKIPVESWEAD